MSNLKQVQHLLSEVRQTGEIFNIEFIKKDNTIRKMNCRFDVKSLVKNTDPERNVKRLETLKNQNMVTVYEMRGKNSSYKTINLSTVTRLTINKKVYNFK